MRGFTLIELIMILLIAAVVSALAMMSAKNPSDINLELAAKKVYYDIGYVREKAMAAAKTHRIYLNTPDRVRAGFANYTLITNPENQKALDYFLGSSYPGVSVLRNYSVAFDSLGRSNIFKTQTSIQLSAGTKKKYIKIIPETGRVYVQ